MRFQHVIVAYFMIGAVMWGAGVIAWDEAGLAGDVVQMEGDTIEGDEAMEDEVGGIGGSIADAAPLFGVEIVVAWSLISSFIGFIFWPITVLQAVNAPTVIVVVVGGGFSTVFIGAVIRVLRSSA